MGMKMINLQRAEFRVLLPPPAVCVEFYTSTNSGFGSDTGMFICLNS